MFSSDISRISTYGSRHEVALDDAALKRVAPSIYAETAYSGMSTRYSFIPTSQVIAALRKEGWQPVRAIQSRVRDEGKKGYQKHMVRFRHVDALAGNRPLVVGDTHPEVVLVNGHDGSSSY